VYWCELGEEKGDKELTCRNIATHAPKINNTDLKYPIILTANYRVIGGMHRICKAHIESKNTIKALQFNKNPASDFVGKNPNELPYQKLFNKNIQWITESAVFLCYSLPLDYYTNNRHFRRQLT